MRRCFVNEYPSRLSFCGVYLAMNLFIFACDFDDLWKSCCLVDCPGIGRDTGEKFPPSCFTFQPTTYITLVIDQNTPALSFHF